MSRISLSRIALALIAISLLSPLGRAPRATAQTDPCYGLTTNPPGGQPEPSVGGTVRLALSGGVSGASVDLFQCSEGSGVYQDTTITDGDGHYAFADLTPGRWYFLEVQLTGPLAGKVAAAGYPNPSAPVGLGDSVDDVDFVME